MATVNTMLGPVNIEDLGFTLMHEHIRESSAGVPQVFPDLFDHASDVIRCSDALNKAASNGVGTIVDVTTMDLGRDIKLMIDANQAYNAYSAIRIANKLYDQDLMWFEEPVNAQAIEAYLQEKS